MRDYSSSNYDFDPYAETQERSFGSLRTIALVGAVALIAAPLITTFARRWRSQQLEARNAAQTEPQIDKTLKDTYPASDPPASRYFDIPENRL